MAMKEILLLAIIRGQDDIMTNILEVKDMIAKVAAGVNGLEKKVADLKKVAADGHVVSQEELDDLANSIKAIGDDLDDTSDQE